MYVSFADRGKGFHGLTQRWYLFAQRRDAGPVLTNLNLTFKFASKISGHPLVVANRIEVRSSTSRSTS